MFEKLFLNDLLDTSQNILMFFTLGSTESVRFDNTLFWIKWMPLNLVLFSMYT